MKLIPFGLLSARFLLILCALVYSSVVWAMYRAVSVIFHTVQGFYYHESTIGILLLSYLLSVIPVMFLPVRSTRVSAGILWFLFFVFYIPSVVIPQFILIHDGSSVLIWMLLLFVGFSLTISGHFYPILRIPKPSLGHKGYFIFLFIIWFVFVLKLYLYYGLSIDLASLSDVYERRAEFIETISMSGSALLGYIVVLSGYWLAPIMLLSGYCYVKCRLKYGWALIFMGAALSVYIYMIAAYKSIALSFIFIFLYAKFMQIRGLTGFKIFIGIMSVISVAWLMSGISGYDFIAHHLSRRAFLSPGMNAAFFYDYFNHPVELNGLLPAEAISRYYYGTNGNANAGFLAAGYALLGAFGVVVVGLSMALALWGANTVTKDMPFAFVTAAFLMQTYALANSAFGTVMITYGFLAVIITLYICPFRGEFYRKLWLEKQ